MNMIFNICKSDSSHVLLERITGKAAIVIYIYHVGTAVVQKYVVI